MKHEKWQVRYADSIRGPILTGCRRNSRGNWHTAPPEHVAEYLALRRKGGRWAVDVSALKAELPTFSKPLQVARLAWYAYRSFLSATEQVGWRPQRKYGEGDRARWRGVVYVPVGMSHPNTSRHVLGGELQTIADRRIGA